MDAGFQQKKNRLDSLSSRLARGSAQARATAQDEPRKCKGCAADLAPGTVGENCGACSAPSSSAAPPSTRRCCPVCGLGVLTVSTFLTCCVCRKWIHADCDRAAETDSPDDYTCAGCRQSPIVGSDAMLGVVVDSPLVDTEASNQGMGSLMGDSMRSSPVAGSIGGESGRFSQRERRMSGDGYGSSDSSGYSARNSPSFDPNACSEDDDEFRPGSSNRGGGASRGGRGGKKKPGGRGGTLMKTRSGGKPPSGVFLDRLGKTERGKRGKGRGAGKSAGATSGKGGGAGTRGRRTSTSGRGGGAVGAAAAAVANAQQVNQLLANLAAANMGNPMMAALLQQQMAAKAAAAAAVAAAQGNGKPARGGDDAPCSSSAAVDCGRGEKDDEYVRTIVIVPEDDAYLSCSPLCLVCGSVGRGTEQSMVACSGCAHSFHTYCVGLQEKMNSTVRDRGWRCLDCTICEGCGKNQDDSKLIMCEECDVAYHMYCLSPPLERAPTGPWRCQWCAKCRRCNMRVANSGELTKEGLCYPCLSLRKCPKCSKLYQLNDNIIRCSQCMKWYHGACEDLLTEEMLESAALNKMRCSSCRPNANRGFSSMNDGNITICDNVALNKCADEVLKSKMMPSLFRANSFTEGSGGSSALAGLLGEFRSGGSIDSHYGGGSMDDENGPDEDGPGSGLSGLITFGPGSRGGRGGGRGGGAGRGRMLKLGVGGFFVKLPKSKMLAAGIDENGTVDPNDPTKKVKAVRKPRRSQLEDLYPSQIQEGFFGTRPVDGKALAEVDVAEPVLEEYKTPKTVRDPFSTGTTLSQTATDKLRTDIEESSMLENMNLNEMMNFDDTLDFDDLFNDDDVDDLALTDALDFVNDDTENSQPKPEMEDEGSSSQPPPQPAHPHPMPHHHPHAMSMQPGMGPGGMMIKQEPGLMHPHMMQQHAHHAMMGPGGMMIKQEPGMMRPESSMSGGSLMAAAVGAAHSGERVSASQAATERWEEDEPLGDKATKAAVLYVNMRYPHLRETMPEWSERAKFIHKTWRGLSSEDRQIYVQKARFNRAQREKVPRPRGPRNPPIGVPAAVAAPTGAITAGHVAMRMAAGSGALPPSTFGMQGPIGNVRGPMPGMPQNPPSLDHLPPDLQQAYMKMRKEAAEFSSKEEALAKELAAIRTTKKKLGAKLRQIQKVETAKAMVQACNAAAAAGLPPPTEVPPVGDLNPMEKDQLLAASAQAPITTKALDDAKRDAKSHVQQMHQFETTHRILTEYVLAHQQTSNAAASSNVGTVGGMLSATMGGRQGMGMGMAGPHGAFQAMTAPPQMPFSQMMGQERTFQLGAIGGSGAMMGSRMGPMARWPLSLPRSTSLGAIRYDQIQSPEERDVYECVDEMIGKISYDLDGPPPMMQQPQQMGGFPGGGPSLKRMLDPMAPPLIGMNPMMQGDDGAPKQKKKRQIQKKATTLPGGQDYESCLDRIRAALAACPPITRKSIEPVPRNEASPFPWAGMSELDRFPEAHATLGNLTLPFALDAYKNIRHAPPPAEVSMARLMPNVRMGTLQQMCHPSSCASPCTPCMVRDEGDLASPSTSQGVANVSNAPGAASDVIRNLVNGVEKKRSVLRCLVKSSEAAFPPTDPHRIAFKEAKREEDEEVEIAIEIEEKCAPGPSGMGGGGGEMSSANSTSSQTCRDEITKALLQKLQQMLETKKPIDDYQMDTPPQSPAGVEPQMEVHPSPLSSFHSPRCRMCDRDTTVNGVQQSMSRLGLTPSDDGKEDFVTFCALKCYYMFVAAAKVALSPEQLASAEAHVDEHTYSRLKQISADSFARCINQSAMARVKPELTVGAAVAAHLASGGAAGGMGGMGGGQATTTGPPPPMPIGGGGAGQIGEGSRENRFSSLLDEPAPRKENVHVIRCSDLAKLDDPGRKERARAAGEDWKKYDQATLETFLKIHRMKKDLAFAPKMGIEYLNPIYDTRKCILCGQKGDGEPTQCGRLLNYDACGWVHANCALWSVEVYEMSNGALDNVEKAIIRGSMTGCVICGNAGATLHCYKLDCKKPFHFGCAIKSFGRFLKDKTFICPNHSDVHSDVLATLEPLRRLYIPRDENKLLARLFENIDGPRLMLRLGGFTFLRLGQLLPEQLKACHNDRFIFPLGYSAQRMYWSPMDARRRIKYTLSITEHEGRPLFTVTMPAARDDMVGAALQGHPAAAQPVVWRKPSAAEAWKEVLDGVANVRMRTGAFLRSTAGVMEAEWLFGLGEGVITKMTESLPGVDTLYSYSFRHGGAAVIELPLAENPSGCARCEPRLRTLIKSHRRPAPSGAKASSSGGAAKRTHTLYEELQMQMRASGIKGDFISGMNGKWGDQYGSTEQSFSAYQKMRKEWKNTVYLARSKIQGLGLYAKKDIDMGAMIIEYKGEIVRGEVCEMREKKYFAQNRGTYMFKASDECIIDATMKGGPARYINHSCDPNCSTHIMSVGNGEDKKIIITANRPIKADEELTYDYQFDIEDDSEKVACLCGAPNCQRWMN